MVPIRERTLAPLRRSRLSAAALTHSRRAAARRLCSCSGPQWLRGLSTASKWELGLSGFQVLIIVALQSAIAGIFANTVSTANGANDVTAKSITVYLVLFILSQVYQFALVLNAVWCAIWRQHAVTSAHQRCIVWRLCARCARAQLVDQNSIQIFVHVLFNGCLFAYSLLQLTQLKGALMNVPNGAEAYDAIYPLLVICCVLLSLFTASSAYLSRLIYLEFGWSIYKKIGATLAVHRAFSSRAGLRVHISD